MLENNSFTKLSKLGVPKEIESNNDPQELLREVRISISTGCQRSVGGNQ